MKASEINGDSGAQRNLWCLTQVNNVTMLNPYFQLSLNEQRHGGQ